MKTLLKCFNLSEDAVEIYLSSLGKFPYTFSELQNILPNASENEIKQIIDELIEKKLILLVNTKYSESMQHYISIPPFAAMLNIINNLIEVSDEENAEESGMKHTIEKFQENIYQDLEKISGDLIDKLTTKGKSGQTMEILSEVEENVKNFTQLILNDVIGMISPLRMQSAVDARDFNRLINSVKQKISESEEIIANMFNQFREIVKSLGSTDIPAEVEAFKTFIRNLGDSIDKRVQEISLGVNKPFSEKIQALEQSLYDLLTNYISLNKESSEKFWVVRSHEKIKEIISLLIEKCKKEILIIVPSVEKFIPLEKFDLDYSKDLSLNQNILQTKPLQKKTVSTGPTITKKQKKEIEEKLDYTPKKVSELKGFELSHYIADILALVSETNPNSAVIDSLQGWLNRLLVIRKHLDSNTQYLLLEAIEKWKKDYLKVKIIEDNMEEEEVEELKSRLSDRKPTEAQSTQLNIKIISSDSHENKHAIALAKKANVEYLQLNENNIIAIIGDNSFLVFGIYQKITNEPWFEISGFFTTYKPMIEIIAPIIVEIRDQARYPKEVEINRGFNEIIDNINDYMGKKIAKKLKFLLDVAFEKDGISLDILELKLLIGKLEKLYQPLDNEMKEYVINELNSLNKKFSHLELIYPPEFRPPIFEEQSKSELKAEITPSPVEPFDQEKIDNLFDLFIEKIDDLKGVEIGEQIDKFIEVILKLQGYSNIVEWRNSLSDVNKPLEEPFKEKIKEDLLSWKLGILNQSTKSIIQIKEQSTESNKYPQQESAVSIFEEEYISPGLAQSQFEAEQKPLPIDDVIDSKTEMKELFNKIQTNIGELNGIEISKLMQNIVDLILETEGYSMTLKDVKNWISKLRKIKDPLEGDLKEDFQLEFLKWKEKYSSEDNETTLEFGSSYDDSLESIEISGAGNSGILDEKFNNLIRNIQIKKGDELSNELQSIADMLLQSHGAVAVNAIRQWISKLRSIKEPLENDIKDEFLAELEIWKEKFT
ncbi:MAG: hypothetical protein ACFE9C_08835 [Candidatus Hodarchaeota archaeon]